MPIYEFRNKETGEIFEHSVSIAGKEQFLLDNPNLEQVHTSMPGFGDPMRMNVPGVGGGDSTFEKYVINRIAETVPGNTIKQRHKTKGSREW